MDTAVRSLSSIFRVVSASDRLTPAHLANWAAVAGPRQWRNLVLGLERDQLGTQAPESLDLAVELVRVNGHIEMNSILDYLFPRTRAGSATAGPAPRDR